MYDDTTTKYRKPIPISFFLGYRMMWYYRSVWQPIREDKRSLKIMTIQ
jgi:hypothetical protein